jgi:hypothetical protein
MSKLSYYQPSGKYNPIAPCIIFIVVLILSSCMGIVSGWLSSEYGLDEFVDLTMIFFFISIEFYYINKIISALVKLLEIRNPEIVYKIGIISASLGWITCDLAIKYFKLSDSSMGFIDFYLNRMVNGFPAGITFGYGSFDGVLKFHAPWFIVIPVTITELLLVPFVFARILVMQTCRPFSEKTKTWHTQVRLPYTFSKPEKKQVKEELYRGNLDIFLELYPDKANLKCLGCWGRVLLFLPAVKDDHIFITVSNIFERILYKNKHNTFIFYYIINKSDTELLMHRFGYNFSKKPLSIFSVENKITGL